MEPFLDNQDISAAIWNKWGLPTRNLSLRACLEKKGPCRRWQSAAGIADGFEMPQSRFLRKKGIRNTRQATRKKTLPNIAQKLPMLEMMKPIAKMMNRI